jgi:hypothetical protein
MLIAQAAGPPIGPTQCNGKDAKGCRHRRDENDVHGHDPLLYGLAVILLEEAERRFDLDQIKIKQESGQGPGTGQCDIRVGMVMEPRIPRAAPPSMNSRMREWP